MGRTKSPCLFVISFDMEQNLVLEPEEIEHSGIQFQVGNHSHIRPSNGSIPNRFVFRKHPVSKTTFAKAFNIVHRHLKRGNTFLANLTFPARVETNLSLTCIFMQAEAPFKLLIPGRFVIFSPELFIQANSDSIRSFPMKGTIDASIPDAREKIMNNPKEIAEHYTIVDLIRNDLSMVAEKVTVNTFRTISEIRTNQQDLFQVSSEICGIITDEFYNHLGTNLFKLLPAGSICGAPKSKTLEIIKAVETYHRGFYTGVFGFFDGASVESAVMIRFLEQTPGGLVYKSGGGITALSDMEKEYQELIDKIYVPFS